MDCSNLYFSANSVRDAGGFGGHIIVRWNITLEMQRPAENCTLPAVKSHQRYSNYSLSLVRDKEFNQVDGHCRWRASMHFFVPKISKRYRKNILRLTARVNELLCSKNFQKIQEEYLAADGARQ